METFTLKKVRISLIINSLALFLIFGILISCGDQKGFYLHPNGATIMCPYSEPGETGFIDGVEYESVKEELLKMRRDEGKNLRYVCTSLVTNMSELFKKSSLNHDIGNWDVSNVMDMSDMFLFSDFTHDISNWDVSNVTDMSGMFALSSFTKPIGNWDVSNVRNMSNMFNETSFNQPIGDWDVSNVTDMSMMFMNSLLFNQPIVDWDVSNVTNMSAMFMNSSFIHDISSWCVRKIDREPMLFAFDSRLTEENKPVWGTCPD